MKSRLSRAALLGVLLFSAGALPAAAQTSETVDRSALRVCCDPAKLPVSNQAGEGFENKIAELVAEELSVPVEYTWFPQSTGFVRNTLKARRCDVVIGISLGFELLQNTNPYYRSAYVMIFRDDGGPQVASLDDPALKSARIGLVAGTPPSTMVALNGLMTQVRPYQLQADTRFNHPGRDLVEDLAKGDIDVGLLWGPIAGYYAKQQDVPLKIVPLLTNGGPVRMDYRITMGLRFNEPEWKRQLNDIIKRRRADIDAILTDYGVPLLNEQGKLIAP